MTQHRSGLDAVFHAVADPTRRGVVERLASGPATTSALAAAYDLALPSFIQHLQVLAASGMVTSHKDGRVRTFELVQDPLLTADAWLQDRRSSWERRHDQLDSLLTALPEGRR